MKHKITIGVIIFLLIALIVIGTIYHFFFSMGGLPHGEFLSDSISPQKKYTVNVYLVSKALSSNAIRCELVNNNTKKSRNIYWGYREEGAEINWVNENMVIINGKKLDVRKDIYDWRK